MPASCTSGADGGNGRSGLLNVGRLWIVVLLANITGVLIAAWVLARTDVVAADVIAGAAEAAFLVIVGGSTWLDFTFGFLLPALAGNIVGGVLLVALLNHAQVVAGGKGTDA